MKLPRDIGGRELGRRLGKLGYRISHQRGSHIRYTCSDPKIHNVTIPDHTPLRTGTLASVLRQVAEYHRLTRPELIRLLFE